MSGQGDIAVIGAGLVGSGWALVFARAGHRVRVHDPDPVVLGRFMAWAKESLGDMASAGMVLDAPAILSRLRPCAALTEALEGVGYVQESVFETVGAKREVSLAIDAGLPPGALVGSSSSGIPASRFTEECRNRDRFLIAHPVNPPHLVPVVELVPAPWTAPDAVARVRVMMAAVGQVPVSLSREIDGFVLNRLQGALLNEAWALYDEGYASLADIDATVAHGLGLRWSFMGPFETIDLNAPGGIADYAARLGGMYHAMARTPRPWPAATVARAAQERRGVLPLEELATRRAWRDAALAQVALLRDRIAAPAGPQASDLPCGETSP